MSKNIVPNLYQKLRLTLQYTFFISQGESYLSLMAKEKPFHTYKRYVG